MNSAEMLHVTYDLDSWTGCRQVETASRRSV